jgi:hypothetical protein
MTYKAGDFPVCEKAAAEIISLPMFPQLTAEQQARVAEEVVHFARLALSPKEIVRETMELAKAERMA